MVPQGSRAGNRAQQRTHKRASCCECAKRLSKSALVPPGTQHRDRSDRKSSARHRMGHYDRKDPTYYAAKKAGLRSRAGIKLEDLDARFRLLAPGRRVVDLGCWPGAWLQVASKRVGAAGRVVGVDLVATQPLGLANVTTLVGDAGDPDVQARILVELGGPVD